MARHILNWLMAALVAVWLIGCGNSPISYRYDKDTTPAERANADKGFARWNSVTLDDSKVYYDPNGEWLVTFTEDIPHNGRQVDGRTCGSKQASCPIAKHIRIRRGVSDLRTEAIATHEAGHALGLDHVKDDEKAVMWGGKIDPNDGLNYGHPVDFVPDINDSDVDECVRAGRCASVRVSPIQH